MFGFGKRPDPTDQTNQFNTPLSKAEEACFQAWRSKLPENLQNLRDYDLRGAWKAGAEEAANGHLPDTWKKPAHITFSDGSQYASAANPAGTWIPTPDGSWTYFAPATASRYRDASDLLNYFQAYEQGNRVVLPANLPRKAR